MHPVDHLVHFGVGICVTCFTQDAGDQGRLTC